MSEAVFWILATLVSFACVITIFGFIAVYDQRKKKRISASKLEVVLSSLKIVYE